MHFDLECNVRNGEATTSFIGEEGRAAGAVATVVNVYCFYMV